MGFFKSNIFLVFTSFSVCLFIGEIALRLFTPFPIYTEVTNSKSHEILGRIMDTRFPGIDTKGFRNEKADGNSDIVVLGDSFSYGYNATSNNSWPQQLGRMTGLRVYNYGIGGYGIPQYYHLMSEAINKKPKYIVVGLYLTNDLNDICTSISTISYWKEWAESRYVNAESCPLKADFNAKNKVQKKSDLNLLRKIKNKLKKLAIISAVDFTIWDPLKFKWNFVPNKNDVIIEDGKNDTIVTESYSIFSADNTDLGQKRIRVSLTIAEIMLREMAEKAKKHGVELFILFIPSKQSSLERYLVSGGAKLSEAFRKVVENEKQLENHFSHFFGNLGVKTANARGKLQQVIKDTGHVYPFQNDDHPTAIGYRSYAQTVFDAFFKKQSYTSDN